MDKELPISPWPEWKIVSKIGEGSFGRVYKAQRTEKGRSFYSAIKIITIPASKGELDSVRSESGDEKSVRGYFENLVEECIQEVSTMEYFRGNSHIVSVEDYKVMEYLDEIGWDIFIRMEYLTSFMEYYAGKNLTEKEVMKLGIDLCRSLEYCGQLHIIHNVSSSLKKLENKGLIKRKQSKDNKKHIEIVLLDDAALIVDAGLNAQKQFAQNVLRGLTEEEKHVCMNVFDKICNNAEELLRGESK